MPARRRTMPILLAAAATALALAGCSGSSADEELAAPATSAAATTAPATAPPSEEASPTASVEAPPSDPCAFAPVGALTKALRKQLGGGELVVDTDPLATFVDGNNITCMYTFPPSHLLAGDGAPYDPELPAQLWLRRHLYTDDEGSTSGSTNCTIGGTNPQVVYSSALQCNQAEARVASTGQQATGKPIGEGGIVTDGWNSAVAAGPGKYWYQVDLTNVVGDPSHVAPLEAAAKVLLASAQ